MITVANVIFPTWMLGLIPSVIWLIMIPANFIVDSLVIIGWAKVKKVSDWKHVWAKSIWKIWIFGFLADFAAAGLLFAFFCLWMGISSATNQEWMMDASNVIMYGWGSFFYGLLGALIGGCLIYLLDRRWAFTKTTLSPEQKKNAAFWMAVITAPWLLSIPIDVLLFG